MVKPSRKEWTPPQIDLSRHINNDIKQFFKFIEIDKSPGVRIVGFFKYNGTRIGHQIILYKIDSIIYVAGLNIYNLSGEMTDPVAFYQHYPFLEALRSECAMKGYLLEKIPLSDYNFFLSYAEAECNDPNGGCSQFVEGIIRRINKTL